MIKFTARLKDGGKKMLAMGLSFENLRRLKDGKPVSFALSDLGLDGGEIGEIMIFAGETEESITNDLVSKGWLNRDRLVYQEPDREQ